MRVKTAVRVVKLFCAFFPLFPLFLDICRIIHELLNLLQYAICWCGGMVYTQDLKSCGLRPCGFESHHQHRFVKPTLSGFLRIFGGEWTKDCADDKVIELFATPTKLEWYIVPPPALGCSSSVSKAYQWTLIRNLTGCSSSVERPLWEREAGGSIPLTPTNFRFSNLLEVLKLLGECGI